METAILDEKDQTNDMTEIGRYLHCLDQVLAKGDIRMKKVLAIDMGATSIRGILGFVEDGKLVLKEVMRFEHKMQEMDGRLRWDMDGLMKHIKEAILLDPDIRSVGIDTWGVDFGLIGMDGKLLDVPICYRDPLHQSGFEEAVSKLSEESIFGETGTQIMSINTLFQLLAYRKHAPEKFAQIQKVLMMPDLIQYLLTGEMVGEETIWSTSQILNLQTGDYSDRLLQEFDIPRAILPKQVKPGHITGNLKNSFVEELRERDVEVISVCGHDTASAVLLTDSMYDEDTMFLSCGTWSLFGVREDLPNLSKEAYRCDMTNELGYASTPLFFKNMTGLYLLEKYKQQLETELGRKVGFSEITSYVQESYQKNPDMESIIDMADARFGDERMNAKEAIDSYLKEKGLPLPIDRMDYFRVIYESMTMKYFEIKQSLEEITGKSYKKLHIIGGGGKSSLLCQLIADRLQVDVKAGPFEASALGNILVQLKNAGEILSMEAGVQMALDSQETYRYFAKK